MNKPISGPWTAGRRHIAGVVQIKDEIGRAIAQAWDWPEAEANAQLIATACNSAKEINPENPIAAAAAMPEIWQLLRDALTPIEEEASRRSASMDFHGEGQCLTPYWREMGDLADRIEALIRQATAKD